MRVARAQFEHAIATLTGQPPAALDIGASKIAGPPPPIPVAVPSQLLERRPDIAASERQVAAANANVGIAETAYYPTLTLSANAGSAGHQSGQSVHLREPQLVRRARRSRRPCSISVAGGPSWRAREPPTTRPSRPTGRPCSPRFRKSRTISRALRYLAEEAVQQQEAVTAAQQSLSLEIDRYRAGTDSYLNVITTQTIALNDQQNAIAILQRRMNAAVDLVKALGGGWDASTLPSGDELTHTSNGKRKT